MRAPLVGLLVLAGLPWPAGAQTPGGTVAALIGYDSMMDPDAVLEDGGLGLDMTVDWFVASRWQVGGGFGLKFGPVGCLTALGSGSSGGGCGSAIDLFTILVHPRFWPVPIADGSPIGVFVGSRLGVAHRVKDGGSAWGVPLGAELGAAVPVSKHVHILITGFVERIFFEQEFDRIGDPDQTATRAGVRIGIGSLFGLH